MIYMYIYSLMLNSGLMFFLAMLFMYLKFSYLLQWTFLKFNSMSMEFIILIDWISLIFISLVSMISCFVLIYSLSYMESDLNIKRFFYLILLFVLSMILMIISPNIMSILVGWDGLGLISYGLIIYYQNWKSFNSGMVTVLMNRVGDVGILMMIGLLMLKGSWNLFLYFSEFKLVIILLLISACTKSAQMPFSIWLPLAMAAPTPVSSLVHSSTLVTAGVYLMIRFNFFIVENQINKYLLLMSSLTMLMSGFVANFENDLKKLIALSTLSQLGLMMSILVFGEIEMGFFHLVMHAMFKSLLFMCSGIVIHLMFNSQDIRCMGSLVSFYPLVSMVFFFSSLSLCGFPFLSGFYSKDLIMESFLMSKMNFFSFLMILIATIFTVSYSIRLMIFVYLKKVNELNCFFMKGEDLLMNSSLMVLFFFSVSGGFILLNMFFYIEKLIILKFLEKILILILCLIGGMVGILLSFKKLNFFNSIFWLKIFIDKMFGLEFIFNNMYMLWNKNSFMNFMKIEKGMLELFFVEGMKMNFLKIFKFYYSSSLNIKDLLFFLVIMLMGFMFFFSVV